MYLYVFWLLTMTIHNTSSMTSKTLWKLIFLCRWNKLIPWGALSSSFLKIVLPYLKYWAQTPEAKYDQVIQVEMTTSCSSHHQWKCGNQFPLLFWSCSMSSRGRRWSLFSLAYSPLAPLLRSIPSASAALWVVLWVQSVSVLTREEENLDEVFSATT